MTRSLAIAALAACTLLAVPAFAQSPAPAAPTSHGMPATGANGAAMKSDMTTTPAVPGSTVNKGANYAMAKTCQGMMDQAMPMMDSMQDGRQKTMAMKQVNMAKMDMTKKHETSCMTHMKTAMRDMK